MPKFTKIDITGQRFGRLTAVAPTEQRQSGSVLWTVLCDCGESRLVNSYSLRKGETRSCGCLRSETSARRLAGLPLRRTHGYAPGDSKSPTYISWINMKQRCQNPARGSYEYYGGAGVKVCDRWQSFENFLADMGERPSLDHCLCRENDSGDYEPGNVVWGLKSDNTKDMNSRRRAA